MNFVAQFKAAQRSGTPLVAVRTFDPASAIKVLKESFGTKAEGEPQPYDKVKMLLWDVMGGVQPLTNAGKEELKNFCPSQGDQQKTVSPSNTLLMAQTSWSKSAASRDCLLFMSNMHLFWGPQNPQVIQGVWNLRNIFKENGHMLVMCINPGSVLPSEIVNDVLVLDEPLPTRERLTEVVTNLHQSAKAILPPQDKLERAVDALVGLPVFGAEQSTAMCIVNKVDIQTNVKAKVLDLEELWEKKRQIINNTPGLKMNPPKSRLANIGGAAQCLEFYTALFTGKKRPKVVIFLDELEKMFAGSGDDDAGGGAHKKELAGYYQTWAEDNSINGGVAVGLPGTGKSETIKALCGEFDIPLITFDVAEMMDKHVGESGARLRAACKTVDAIGGGNVFAFATSNGLDGLPLGLRRRFEFAPTFFYDVPTPEEKKIIWHIHMKGFNLDLKQPLPSTPQWTGAEIKQCCGKADALGLSVEQAAKWVVPVTESDAQRIDYMRKLATGKYLSASVPGRYHYDESKPLEVIAGTSERRMKEEIE